MNHYSTLVTQITIKTEKNMKRQQKGMGIYGVMGAYSNKKIVLLKKITLCYLLLRVLFVLFV